MIWNPLLTINQYLIVVYCVELTDSSMQPITLDFDKCVLLRQQVSSKVQTQNAFAQ